MPKIAELSCPVALHAAASTVERIAGHMPHRAAGNRVRRKFIGSDTGKPVEKDDQVKGYKLGEGDSLALVPDEIAVAVQESDQTLAAAGFGACKDIDDACSDHRYCLTPADRTAEKAFALIREGMRRKRAAALFRRVRTAPRREKALDLMAARREGAGRAAKKPASRRKAAQARPSPAPPIPSGPAPRR